MFFAAVFAESVVLLLFIGEKLHWFEREIGFLWFNVIGAMAVIILGLLFQLIWKNDANLYDEKRMND